MRSRASNSIAGVWRNRAMWPLPLLLETRRETNGTRLYHRPYLVKARVVQHQRVAQVLVRGRIAPPPASPEPCVIVSGHTALRQTGCCHTAPAGGCRCQHRHERTAAAWQMHSRGWTALRLIPSSVRLATPAQDLDPLNTFAFPSAGPTSAYPSHYRGPLLLGPSLPSLACGWLPALLAPRANDGLLRSECPFGVTVGRQFTPGLVRVAALLAVGSKAKDRSRFGPA